MLKFKLISINHPSSGKTHLKHTTILSTCCYFTLISTILLSSLALDRLAAVGADQTSARAQIKQPPTAESAAAATATSNVNTVSKSSISENDNYHMNVNTKQNVISNDKHTAHDEASDKAMPSNKQQNQHQQQQQVNDVNNNDADHEQVIKRHSDVHKLMSDLDLRRTFQVESRDQVPEYEILKLTINSDGSHLISPISDLGELTTIKKHEKQQQQKHHEQQQQQPLQQQQQTKISVTTKSTSNIKPIDAGPLNVAASLSSLGENAYREDDDDDDDNDNYDHRGVNTKQHKRSPPQSDDDLQTTTTHMKTKSKSGDKGTTTRFTDAKMVENDTSNSKNNNNNDHEPLDKMIVMNLSTFGQKFKLRLKRNTDFQQRIKDMKMFMAESTQDGQLRYTEIRNNANNNNNNVQGQQHQQQHQPKHHQMEPHKRAASDDNEASGRPTSAQVASDLDLKLKQQQHHKQRFASVGGESAQGGSWQAASGAEARSKSSSSGDSSEPHNSDIGLTYHDEHNLAALLIEHDKSTGQLQVDGTIGNDFVIKPMPKATLDALMSRQQQQQHRQSANAIPIAEAGGAEPRYQQGGVNETAAAKLERLAAHMHDDDPHDDDEMFLDEDEALEMAHQQQRAASPGLPRPVGSTSAAGTDIGHTNHHQVTPPANDTTGPEVLQSRQDDAGQSQSQNQAQPRQLSKAAAERKWRKYRKLVAQTHVPKPAAVAATRRARRHAHATSDEPRPLSMSHHIVYRMRPSSEDSTDAHRHSFMLAPGQQSMEAMARRFVSLGRGSGDAAADTGSGANPIDTDSAPDPMGGQFYLEPGLIPMSTNDDDNDNWMLIGHKGRAPLSLVAPDYAINATEPEVAAEHRNCSTTSGRFKRQVRSVRQHARHGPQPAMMVAASGGGGAVPPKHKQQQEVRRFKRQAPDTVWPEVLLVVDYDSFLLHNGDSRDVKRYFVSFWNGVDLRYKLLVHPHIRISLAGMIVAKDRDATPYLERNRLRAPNADAVDAAGALTDMGKYLYREDRLPTYDLAVVITKLDMCRRRYEGGRCNRGTAGFAYVGGACVVNKRLEKVNSVAIIEDSGGFSGIIVAAHEVGHLLGCVHDGSPPPSYLGGPGATHCPWEDGFIMSDLRHTERGFRWSQCSVEQFKHFLNGETATCLYNYPHESQMLHRLLPGTMLSLDEQCKRDRGTNACFKDARVCAQLFCFDSASGYCVSYRPAAEGSPCGEGQVCRNGKCVGEIENIIPDYTHQSQTVIARRPNALVAAASSAPVSIVGAGAGSPVVVGVVAPASVRLADNGLSASSTSSATSAPEPGTKPITSSGANQAASVSSRRMDTFTPTNGSPGAFGGRTASVNQDLTSADEGLVSHQGHSMPYYQQAVVSRNGKPVAADLQHQHHRQQALTTAGGSSSAGNSNYQSRSGQLTQQQQHRAPWAGYNLNQSQNQRRYSTTSNQQQFVANGSSRSRGLGLTGPMMQTSGSSSSTQYLYPISSTTTMRTSANHINRANLLTA